MTGLSGRLKSLREDREDRDDRRALQRLYERAKAGDRPLPRDMVELIDKLDNWSEHVKGDGCYDEEPEDGLTSKWFVPEQKPGFCDSCKNPTDCVTLHSKWGAFCNWCAKHEQKARLRMIHEGRKPRLRAFKDGKYTDKVDILPKRANACDVCGNRMDGPEQITPTSLVLICSACQSP